jgi:hypothetical protein
LHDDQLPQAQALVDLARKEWELRQFTAGQLTMLEEDSPVTPQIVLQW